MSLVVSKVTKRFRDVTAVDNLSFTVAKGSLCGFLGPNGAGKTTTMRVVLGILRPDEGEALWEGRPLHTQGRGLFGYLPEERGLYPKMRVDEHLEFLGRLNGLAKLEARRKTEYWIDYFDLGELSKKRIEELSKGNQQKVQTIATMLHDPDLLILDEPFAGLDPVNTALLKRVLKEHHLAGKTIIFSSHRMEQVEEICEDIILIHQGKLVLNGNLRQIKRSLGHQTLQLSLEGDQDFWVKVPGLSLLESRADYLEFSLQEGLDPNNVLEAAMEAGQVTRFELVEPSLSQIFVEKVGVKA